MSAPSDRRRRLHAILGPALDFPSVERRSFLDSACGDDLKLRRSAENLIHGALASSTFVRQGGGLRKSAWDTWGRVKRYRLDDRLQPGRHLSHYRLVAPIGEGGMGVVWKATDTVLRRTVAIKVLPAEAASCERRRRMFLREAQVASSVGESCFAQIYEFVSEGDLDYIVMEHIKGKSLDRILKGRALPARSVIGIGRQIASALSRAHRRGLLHRDIKPSNILVSPEGEVKLVDFGLATPLADADAHQIERTGLTVNEAAIRFTDRAGTPPYMSPEQIRGEALDGRSDVFSLGVVLYEMATGRRPFQGTTPVDVFREILGGKPAAPRDLVPEIPPDLERVILRALADLPSARYPTMEALVSDLIRLDRDLEGTPPPVGYGRDERFEGRSRFRLLMAGGYAALLLSVLLAWLV